MGDCLFCAIAGGSIPSARVYEDDDVVAFLDIQPLREGHTLVVPRHHAQRLIDLDRATLQALAAATQQVLRATLRTLGTEDATVAVNDGPAAGQEIPHVHVHIVPRRPGDEVGPIHALFSDGHATDADALGRLAARMREHTEAA